MGGGDDGSDLKNIEVTPAKAFLSNTMNNLASLSLFFLQYESVLQLSQQKREFSQPFLWLPSLSGPNEYSTVGFDAITNLPETAPFFLAPILLFGAMILSQKVDPMR